MYQHKGSSQDNCILISIKFNTLCEAQDMTVSSRYKMVKQTLNITVTISAELTVVLKIECSAR